jgi:hypothetical protein
MKHLAYVISSTGAGVTGLNYWQSGDIVFVKFQIICIGLFYLSMRVAHNEM